jgi:hypothetical protein
MPQKALACGQALQSNTLSGSRTEFRTLLTFIDGALVGGNYDAYAQSCATDRDTVLNTGMERKCIFQVTFQSQQRSPSLTDVAEKIADQEGKSIDEK